MCLHAIAFQRLKRSILCWRYASLLQRRYQATGFTRSSTAIYSSSLLPRNSYAGVQKVEMRSSRNVRKISARRSASSLVHERLAGCFTLRAKILARESVAVSGLVGSQRNFELRRAFYRSSWPLVVAREGVDMVGYSQGILSAHWELMLPK